MNFWNIARPEESPVLKKTLSIMRLTTLFSIACSLQISASVYSQETKLSLDVNNQTIKEVLFKIEKQSGFRFIDSFKIRIIHLLLAKIHFFEDRNQYTTHFFDDNTRKILHFLEDSKEFFPLWNQAMFRISISYLQN